MELTPEQTAALALLSSAIHAATLSGLWGKLGCHTDSINELSDAVTEASEE